MRQNSGFQTDQTGEPSQTTPESEGPNTNTNTNTRNACTQQPLAQGNDMRMQIFSFSPCTFQETVGSHLKPSLPVVVMATLCHGNNLIETFL